MDDNTRFREKTLAKSVHVRKNDCCAATPRVRRMLRLNQSNRELRFNASRVVIDNGRIELPLLDGVFQGIRYSRIRVQHLFHFDISGIVDFNTHADSTADITLKTWID